jgi:hypothetical protein
MAEIIRPDYQYAYLTSATTTQVATGTGVLHAIVVGETSASTVAIIDGISGTTASIGTLKASIAEGTYVFDANFNTGLRIDAGASKLTVVYTRK